MDLVVSLADMLWGWEGLAALLSVCYVVLAAEGSRWCWPAAFISTAIYTWLFYGVNLQLDSLLQIYYMYMAVYGWWRWRRGVEDKPLTVVEYSWRWHAVAIVALLLPTYLLARFGQDVLHTDFPYWDAFTTCFAVFATYLVANKVLSNWLYFFIIDTVSVYLYVMKGLHVTALLFTVYSLVCIFGYFRWRGEWQGRTAQDSR
ncbi:nicotinamide mononucleotide transporter [Sinobacterium caligoides]|uniref:Nicotinamide riboside transporter PnuC n=1 Tax=Sinobacterium caligoides TaxID=933926 RepID=A0A3N2DYF6_9GAMM|nr:nicotinamide riboside transporter PnuC [Sinobacterium caligoides]ROS04858.1 nicotinamide mononucleotide transporter [Sinobacterium caligoides]